MAGATPWRDHRLRKRPEFQMVYQQGRSSGGPIAVIFCLRRGDDGPWRLGLTATLRVGKAVDRNRARRRAREFFRRRRERIAPGWDFVVNLRRAAVMASVARFEREMAVALGRLGIEKPVAEITAPGPSDPTPEA